MKTVAPWIEWKQRCALQRCELETKRELERFAHSRFRRYVRAYARMTNARDSASLVPEPGETWHRFEALLQVRNTRAGKSYKEWIFSRGGEAAPRVETIESGVTLLMRDVVREYLRNEFSNPLVVSLDAPLDGSSLEGSLTLRDLLPAPTNADADVALRDIERLAEGEAAEVIRRLHRRERVALLVRELGLSLAHPEATRAARCGKSALNNAYHQALRTVAGHVRELFGREGRDTVALLTCAVFRQVRRHVFEWGHVENDCARLFTVGGAEKNEARGSADDGAG